MLSLSILEPFCLPGTQHAGYGGDVFMMISAMLMEINFNFNLMEINFNFNNSNLKIPNLAGTMKMISTSC